MAAAVGQLVHKADFERLLSTPGRWRSAHFAMHHVGASPSRCAQPPREAQTLKLSTDDAPNQPSTVDKSPCGHWLGMVVPKRHARRAVTRSLIKRQMRAALQRHVLALSPGLWLLRLRQPFAVGQFPSAASAALTAVVRQELDGLMQRATQRASPRA